MRFAERFEQRNVTRGAFAETVIVSAGDHACIELFHQDLVKKALRRKVCHRRKRQGNQTFDPELMNLKGASADEMRAILSSYNISEKKINVIPWQNPLSSYIGEWWLIKEGEDADKKMSEYTAFARGMLFGVVVN